MRTAEMIGTYNYSLVFLSLIVATLASFTALDLATRIAASQGAARRAWLAGGALAMGAGIWSMHFIGMLAFTLPLPVGYDVALTLVSLVIAIITSGFSLHIVSGEKTTWRDVLGSGVLMGLGMCAMHYSGMEAMQITPGVTYNPFLVALSGVIAIVASQTALGIAFTLRSDEGWMRYAKAGSAVVMASAMSGMHYTGMAAASFDAETMALALEVPDNLWMAGTVAGATFLILCVTLHLSVLDARMASKAEKMAASLQRANDELQQIALHDPLTKLPNRVLLDDRIQQAIVHAQRSKRMCAVLFIDLDRFKTINDSLGHMIGDELLRAVAARLASTIRAGDTVSRIGGDEFVILLREISDVETTTLVASKVLNALRGAIRVHEHELFVTPSIGISVYPTQASAAQMLITCADAAMYNAKQAGRNTFKVFTSEMNTFFPDRLKLEQDLRCALERREFELHYQPKVDVQLGRMSGMEALVRWRHPERGLLAPQEFISLAEETGLIIPVGRWVLEEACRQNKAWQDMGLPRLRVSVNMSGVQFRDPSLLEIISTALSSSGLDPTFLEIEITESVIMHNASDAIVTLERVKEMGVHVSIDDFGTGYSSLAYLKRFPIDKLKIDRAFIRDVSTDLDDAAIVRATIGLAHNLRLKVVAEGVETSEQLGFLRSLGCDEYQGYHKSKPVPAQELERALREDGLAALLVPVATDPAEKLAEGAAA